MGQYLEDIMSQAFDEADTSHDFIQAIETHVSLGSCVESWPNDDEKRQALKRLLKTLPKQYVETLLEHMGYIKAAKLVVSGSSTVSGRIKTNPTTKPLFGTPDEIFNTGEQADTEPKETEQQRIARVTKQMCGRYE